MFFIGCVCAGESLDNDGNDGTNSLRRGGGVTAGGLA